MLGRSKAFHVRANRRKMSAAAIAVAAITANNMLRRSALHYQ
jgi:hypothetical protein